MASNVEVVSERLSARFGFVTLLPNLVVVSIVATVIAAGAPTHRPTFNNVGDSVKHLDGWGWAGLGLLLIVGSVAMHALQTPIIQLLEGYWHHLPFGDRLAEVCRSRFVDEKDRIGEDLQAEGPTAEKVQARALERDRWMPSRDDILPTELGNVLTRGEELSTSRYGMEVLVAFPRLMHVAPADELKPLLDRRTQLDASARLSVAFLVAAFVTLGLLLPTARWMWVPLVCVVFAWVAYRSAIAAAKSFTDELQVIADLYHLDLWKALRLPIPATLAEELAQGQLLLPRLRYGQTSSAKAALIRWPPVTRPD